MRSFDVDEITLQLGALGVSRGGVLLVHTSFHAVGPIAGGPLGLIAALRTAIGPEGTLVMPTMSDGESEYDPRTTPTCDMGITAELFWREAGVIRSDHPGASFAAIGSARFLECGPSALRRVRCGARFDRRSS